jgi:hypothetical protein
MGNKWVKSDLIDPAFNKVQTKKSKKINFPFRRPTGYAFLMILFAF